VCPKDTGPNDHTVFKKTSHGGTKDTETTEEFKLYIPPCLRALRVLRESLQK